MLNEKYDYTDVPGLLEIISEFSERAKKEKPIWFAKLATINLGYKGKGFPAFDDELETQIKNKEVALGGCVVYEEYRDEWHCNECGHEF